MSTKKGEKKLQLDADEKLINNLKSRVSGKFYDDDAAMAKIRKEACSQFPVIRSHDDPHADFESIRKRMKSAAKIAGAWRGSIGFIEVSIKDMLDHGCVVCGRNFVLPEGGLGVHDVVHPECSDGKGKIFSSKEREDHRKKCRRLLGCNCNGSGTAKALLAATCLRLGIRCILNVSQCLIVDTWPDREKVSERYAKYHCSYSVS